MAEKNEMQQPLSEIRDIPLVSIIMPAYNAEVYIEESIRSVLTQSYTNWELIVVDDGSTDTTTDKIRMFNDPRIRLIHAGRVGILGAVRNIGLKHAQGAFIAFMDSDDLYEPDALETLLSHLLTHEDCTAVYGFYREIDEEGRLLEKQPEFLIPDRMCLGAYRTPDTYRHTWKHILTCDVRNAVQGLMLRKETLARVGLQSEYFKWPDYVFYIKLFIDHFDGVQYTPHHVFRYRIHLQSDTRNRKGFDTLLAQIPELCGWIFSKDGIPAEFHHLKSEIYARNYAQLARSRYDGKAVRQLLICVMAALTNPNIKLGDWLLYCLPYAGRILLPKQLDQGLRALWLNYKPLVLYGGKKLSVENIKTV